jgi:ubiquinone/menaquinone biosynthesis C-methylase UbiE
MKERHVSREKMQWLEMDILDLKFEDESFDLVIDKG